MSHALLANAFVAEQVEEAIAPFRGQLSDEDLDWMRNHLATLLEEDPRASTLLQGALPRTVQSSGEQQTLKMSLLADDTLENSGSE